MKTLNQALQDKILYIGDKIPSSLFNDERAKFIILGNPQELMDEVSTPSKKSEFETACWIAEYAYRKTNPESRMGEPPSMVYEQVAKDYSNFLSS